MDNELARKPVGKLFYNYALGNVTTGAWVEIIANIPASATEMHIFDSSGRVLKLSTGAAGDEANHELLFYIFPGGSDALLPTEWAKNSRLAAKAVDANATTGYLIINFYG
jgi:hypothetical protein